MNTSVAAGTSGLCLRCAFLHRLLLCRRTTNQGCERLLELKAIMSLWEFSSVACVTTDLTTTTATTRTATTVMPTTTTNTTGMIIACGSDPGQLFYSNSIESVQQLRRRLGNTSIQKCLNYTALNRYRVIGKMVKELSYVGGILVIFYFVMLSSKKPITCGTHCLSRLHFCAMFTVILSNMGQMFCQEHKSLLSTYCVQDVMTAC